MYSSTSSATVMDGGTVTGSACMKLRSVSPSSARRTMTCLYDICDALRRNIPIMNHQSPPTMLPPTNANTPSTTSPVPKNVPMPAEIFVAQRRFPRAAHSAARNTRPPSSGNAGTMLNTASTMFSHARYASTSPVTSSPVTPRNTVPMTRHTSARNRLMSGPAIAIRNSERASWASSCISATPPNRKSVMPSMGIP